MAVENSFKSGDKVLVKKAKWTDSFKAFGLNQQDVHTVEYFSENRQYPSIKLKECIYEFDANSFEKVEDKKFCVGDRVISTKDTPNVPEGFIGSVEQNNGMTFNYSVISDANISEWFNEDELELLQVSKNSIARPILEERKVGKVQMDLFDSGFPNAITEVAKVMTWAAENKGYKPHDWKGLPNAETEFSAAASRHRVKGFIQKANDIEAIDRTDEESNIVHLAHAAFNILAELELVLTGKIK